MSKLKERLKYFLVFLFIITIFFNFHINRVGAKELIKKKSVLKRLEGLNRYETSIAICKFGFQDTSDNLILATGEDFPDSLCAAPLASKLKAPILLTQKDFISDEVKNQITRLKVKNVYLIGGVGVLSKKVESEVKNMNVNIIRIDGKDRYETSLKIINLIGDTDKVFVVTGNDFPDALSVASIAAKMGIPIILTDKNSMTDGVNQYISRNHIQNSYIIGGQGIISDNIKNRFPNSLRIFGHSRYETNVEVLIYFSQELNLDMVYMATGEDFPDALSGAAISYSTNSPMILCSTNINETTENYIKSNSFLINKINFLGGEAVVSSKHANIVDDYQGANAKKPLKIPTYDGSNQSTHPKVLYFSASWNGWKYWMVMTPYPNSNDYFENPSILVSNNGVDWSVPRGLKNPIAIPPKKTNQHNSDGHLVYNKELNQLELWYRYTSFDEGDTILKSISTDGTNWSSSEPMLKYVNKQCLSPAIIREDGKYKIWYVNEELKCIYIESADGVSWTAPLEVQLNLPTSYVPWHLDMVHTEEGYEILISSFKTGELYLNNRVLMWGVSSDGLSYNNIEIVMRPSNDKKAWDNMQIYRSSFVKIDGIYNVFYSAMDREHKWHIGLSKGYNMKQLYGTTVDRNH
jgi:putative cell wall-binding protein